MSAIEKANSIKELVTLLCQVVPQIVKLVLEVVGMVREVKINV